MVLAVYVSSLSCESLTWFNITMCSMHDLLISVSTEISYPWESFFGFRVMVVRLNFPFLCTFSKDLGFPSGPVVKNLPANAEDAKDAASIPGWERSPDIGNGNLLQYSCLENSLDRKAWQVIDHGVAKSQTQLSTHAHTNDIQALGAHRVRWGGWWQVEVGCWWYSNINMNVVSCILTSW